MSTPTAHPLERLIADIRADQAMRWRRGERVPAECYFQAHEALRGSIEAAVEIVYAEYLLRVEDGQRPALAEFSFRFPWLAATLEKQFEFEQAIVAIDEEHAAETQPEDDMANGSSSLPTARDDTRKCRQDAAESDATGAPRCIGRFELVERIGSGSFGVVWKARDTELDRIVALKIPHAGQIDPERDAARFLREGRSAARLRHPGIVPLHEVGYHDGVPFLVSDFIEGTTLVGLRHGDEFEFRHIAILVRQVAEALEFAHQMGVVHRDVKPSNIMLEGSQSFQARALLLDFGLARCDDAERTASGDAGLVGTLAYMSPEQATGENSAVGSESDVYSLGVVLYELLTGLQPFRGSTTTILEQIFQAEPLAPRRLNHAIPADLETICLKAMAKEPKRRYVSAGELADDLDRFLDGKPIRARPVHAVERLWRWSKRHPSTAALVVTVATCLVALAAGSSVAAVRIAALRNEEATARKIAIEKAADEKRQRRAAEESLTRAEAAEANSRAAAERERVEAQTAQKVSGFLETLFGTLDPFSLYDSQFAVDGEHTDAAALLPASPELTSREILDRAAGRVVRDFADQPDVQLKLLLAIASAYNRLQMYDKAISVGGTALDVAARAWGETDQRVAEAQYELGRFLMQANQPAAAIPHLRATVDYFRALPDQQADSVKLGRALSTLGSALTAAGPANDAEKYLREGVELLRAAPPDHAWELSASLGRLAEWQRMRRDHAQAESSWREAWMIAQRVRGRDHPYVLSMMFRWAQTLAALGRKDEAAARFDEAIAGMAAFLGPPRADFVGYLIELSRIRRAQNDLERAERAAAEAVERARGLPSGQLNWTASAGVALAQVLIKQKRIEDAVRLAGPIAAARLQYAAEADSAIAKLQADALQALLNGDKAGYRASCSAMLTTNSHTDSGLVALTIVTTCLWSPNSTAESKRLIELADRVVQQRPDELEWHATRGAALYRDGQFEAAVRALTPMVALGEHYHLGTAHERFYLAMAMARVGKARDAEKWLASGKLWVAANSPLVAARIDRGDDSEGSTVTPASASATLFDTPPEFEIRFWRLQELLEREAETVVADGAAAVAP